MKFIHIYFSFKGRLSLKDYWLYWIIPFIIIEFLLAHFGVEGPQYTWLWRISNAIILWPAIATSVKRLHDMNKTGWWTLGHLIPILGNLILTIILCFIPGTKCQNQYG